MIARIISVSPTAFMIFLFFTISFRILLVNFGKKQIIIPSISAKIPSARRIMQSVVINI